MAPETLERCIYSEQSDIWSIGVILYEMLHGRPPFKSQSEAQLKREIKQPVTELLCSKDFARLITNCLQPDRLRRVTLPQLMEMYQFTLRNQQRLSREKELARRRKDFEKQFENEVEYVQFMRNVMNFASVSQH